MRVCFLLLFVCVVFAAEDEEEAHRRRIIDQLTRTRTVLLDDYQLVSRQIATDVYMYRSYRTVSVVFYPVMRDVSSALFTFQSEELHMNTIGSCQPKEVIVNLKHGSYPAVNPDGYEFPSGFVDTARRESIHTLELLSDGLNRTYTIDSPQPGNWYALVYIKWEDPRTQKVKQQGLTANCQTILYTDLQVKREELIELIDCYSGITLDYNQIPQRLKCMSLDNAEPIAFNLTIVNTRSDNKEVTFKAQALTFPTDDTNLINCAFDPRGSNIQSITFTPHPSAWHYIDIGLTENSSNVADCESYYLRADDGIDNNTILDLMRDDKGRFFTFEYGLPTTDLQDTTSMINITSGEIKSLRFKVNQFLDIGGTLTLEISLYMSLKYYMGYVRELREGSLLAFTEDDQFFKAVICMDIGHTSIPLESGHCKYNDKVTTALFVLNSTDSESIYDKVIIPFPESGTWYLTVRLFCDSVVCPCRMSQSSSEYFVNANESAQIWQNGTNGWNETRDGSSECNASLLLSVSSSSCVSGRCSNRGNCLLNTFGGLVMSYCSCYSGYGGWDCSDNSRMESKAYMLSAVLLLTLSNILFFFSIYVAIVRLYYTEAMMYTFTMVFSTFYHACDAPAQIQFCILRGNILQFGDFYCGLMSFWVTLLAMSIVGDKFRSWFQLTGAIVIAILTTWNMHSFYSFFAPVTIGIVILILSWYLDYRENKSWRYPKSYYTVYMPLGLLSVTVGLVCYAFLQTEQNYKIVHSLWHIIIAISVAFLLPDVKRENATNPFVPKLSHCRLPFCRIFNRSRVIETN